jgi:pyruvate kinase
MVISNLRPKNIILALCPSELVARSLSLNYGVYPVVTNLVLDDDMDETVNGAKETAINVLKLKENDIIIITGGIHHNKAVKQTNFMKIEEI